MEILREAIPDLDGREVMVSPGMPWLQTLAA
jgi:hypothetical protein